ncbi:MAG: pilus assembly PilX N-terminal domain-containing protein [Candidatus Pacebacteria bacterium]|nr:pilus assembly PilX N-terminal domain-containing protein [Candidatus Paceibacterota bacterium]
MRIINLKSNTAKNKSPQDFRHSIHLRSRGFTLFIALIVSSLLLAIGFSLSTIILKQLVFANSGKESQLAFYAADSGSECALYWDRKDINGVTVFDGSFATSTNDSDIFCGTGGPGSPQTAQVGSFNKINSPDNLSATTTFYVDYSDPSDANFKACAKVSVSKWIDTSGSVPLDKTEIDSRGYNVPLDTGVVGPVGDPVLSGAKCDFTNVNRVVERAVRLDY